MGSKIIQQTYSCDLCDKTPDNGEALWRMGHEVWCEQCCDEQEELRSKKK